MKIASLLLLAALALAGCSRSEPAAPPAAAAAAAGDAAAPTLAQLAAGKAIFERVCAVCHQSNGLGVPAAFPPLAGSAILTEADPGKIIRATLHGLQGPITVKGQTFNSVMPPQGPLLKDHELAAALTYARNAWGNSAPAVATDAVTVVRLAVKRETLWTWAELSQP